MSVLFTEVAAGFRSQWGTATWLWREQGSKAGAVKDTEMGRTHQPSPPTSDLLLVSPSPEPIRSRGQTRPGDAARAGQLLEPPPDGGGKPRISSIAVLSNDPGISINQCKLILLLLFITGLRFFGYGFSVTLKWLPVWRMYRHHCLHLGSCPWIKEQPEPKALELHPDFKSQTLPCLQTIPVSGEPQFP